MQQKNEKESARPFAPLAFVGVVFLMVAGMVGLDHISREEQARRTASE